jgi:hypothetical protein
MSDYYLTSIEQLYHSEYKLHSIRWWWSPLVLDQHDEMDLYSASSLKHQSEGRRVVPLGHVILIPSNQSLLLLLNDWCLAEKLQIPMVWSLVWTDRGSNQRSIALEASTLTITPSMRLTFHCAYKVGRVSSHIYVCLRYWCFYTIFPSASRTLLFLLTQ